MRRGQWECTGAGRKDGSVEQGAVYVKVWRAGWLPGFLAAILPPCEITGKGC